MSTWFLVSKLSTCVNFKTALYFGALVIKLLTMVKSCFSAKINAMRLKASF